MIEIIVNAPKGGVGKTTISTNIALYLKNANVKVKAIDLAQGELLTSELNDQNFSSQDIITCELGSISKKGVIKPFGVNKKEIVIDRKKELEFIVVDTDDYVDVLTDLLKTNDREIYVVVPIISGKYELKRIPKDMEQVLKSLLLQSKTNVKIFFLLNKINSKEEEKKCRDALKDRALDSYILDAKVTYHKNLICTDNSILNSQIEKILQEMEII
ncbi:hypothetical protein HMPREF0202_01540 [Cetobacterium somerae ATCC BAA-474]|uniref:CobQ/CobB/MinD/ParA nucleotide binding domain-containing protein n=1 Tax=Cetobacterium somerae ATCC BAA-474 TaxID=1319815 RepID=U7VCN4_9FUSO|nr:AAA family ATPase [Cetobacterium somerae]ERT68558.1 hypothetical protein HMPREF0202_01540 [Cetobacterium somerae ATCC BAA-474]